MKDLSRVLLIIVAISIIIMDIYRFTKNPNNLSKGVIKNFFIGGILFPIHPIMRKLDISDNLGFYIIAVLSQYYSIFFVHIGEILLRSNKIYINIFKKKLFWFINIISTIIIILILKEHENLNSFSDNQYFIRTDAYYLFYFLNYSLLSIICISMLIEFTKWKYSYQDIKRTIWWYLCPISTSVLLFGMAVMTLNVLLSYFLNDTYKHQLNNIYSYSKTIFAFSLGTIVLIPLIPNRLLSFISNKIEKFSEQKRLSDEYFISIYHKSICEVIPRLKMYQGIKSINSQLVDIADANLIIWSHKDQKDFISPKNLARLIASMKQKNQIIENIGNNNPYIQIKNEKSYAVKVGRHIYELQNQ